MEGVMMNYKVKNLLQEKCNNYIFPFLWLHGEEESVLREYMEAIHACGIGAVCVESRPHPDFCGPQWWHDMDIILEEAKKRNMKVWILDDSHFPTGYANGAMKDAPAELCRRFLYYSAVEVVGSGKSVQLNITKHAKYVRNPMVGNYFSMMDSRERRWFDDDALLSVCAVRMDQGFDVSSLVDITKLVTDGQLIWEVPAGRWRIYVNYLTRNAGSRSDYINVIHAQSVRKQIEAVYEPHYEHYKEEFGRTIAGFFSDEPELGNGLMYSELITVGTDHELPWSDEAGQLMSVQLGNDWKTKLPLLWENGASPDETARMRYAYMDIVTRLVEKDFSRQLGMWCEDHGVEYIGHLIEDNNMHARLGPSLGHYFRGLSGQHMSGIDVIRGQIVPAGELSPTKDILSSRDGEFFHYVLAKLGSSFAAIDPIKKGRAMCEIFGAYRWGEGVRLMKYLVDHCIIRGINHYVPHAFSCKPYPDSDCPPHFYANGHDPQFRHFGALMRYLNRMCALISDGQRITPAAILYHGEAEWTGKYMLDQKPAHVLADNQIDFDILPSDVFAERARYRTRLGRHLLINGREYKVLIIPYAQYMTGNAVKAIIELQKEGFPVLFIDGIPTGIADGDKNLLTGLSDCKVVTLDNLAAELRENAVPEIVANPAFSMLRYLHYKEDNDIYIFTNENMAETFCGTVTVPTVGSLYVYDVWRNELHGIKAEQKEEGTVLYLDVPPYQSVVVIFDQAAEIECKASPAHEEEIPIEDGWRMSLVIAKDYPKFHDEQEISHFTNIGLLYPEFSGFIRYENTIEVPAVKAASLIIEDAFEGVEVFVNGESAGIQIVPPFIFDIGKLLNPDKNTLRIEVATTLERERNTDPPLPGDLYMMLKKAPAFEPTGIVGGVKLRVIFIG